MLCLGLKTGEYLTLGSDVVIQCQENSNTLCRLAIQAPKEVKILRGKVREETGQQRPDCVFDVPAPQRARMTWDRSKAESLAKIRRTLAAMDDTPERQILIRHLDLIFPPK